MALVGCVLEGTKITMADGSKKAIEDIKPGDEVLGYNFETGETVPTVVVMNLHEKPSRTTRMNLFSDGTMLSTVGEHHIFEVDGDPCRDVNDLKTDSKVMKENGDIVTFNGYYNRTDALFESYNLLTSNNTYFAEGIMNSCFPPAKFNHLKERHVDMPTQLFNEVETELNYSRDGAYRLNNPDFIREVIELTKNKRSIYETIKSDKKELADSDWSTIKLCEQVLEALKEAQNFDEYKTSVITLLEEKAAKTLEKRAQRRAQINAIENAEKEYNDQIKALKVKYNILTDFDELSLVEQFKECNKLGNANYNLYKTWLQK